jgi:hypothetical protein
VDRETASRAVEGKYSQARRRKVYIPLSKSRMLISYVPINRLVRFVSVVCSSQAQSPAIVTIRINNRMRQRFAKSNPCPALCEAKHIYVPCMSYGTSRISPSSFRKRLRGLLIYRGGGQAREGYMVMLCFVKALFSLCKCSVIVMQMRRDVSRLRLRSPPTTPPITHHPFPVFLASPLMYLNRICCYQEAQPAS